MRKILIIRNDKLGDFMLAYPSFALAKINLPNTEIHTLVPQYTEEIAKACKWIDKVIIDPGKESNFTDTINLIKSLKQENYDAVITLFSTTRIALITKIAGIPYRLAPATKFAQLFYNHKLVQRRSRSEKPEYIYNMDLISHFLNYAGVNSIQLPHPPYLEFSENEIQQLKEQFLEKHNIPQHHKLIFIHAGSGGSANNMTPKQFASLATKLRSQMGHTIIITAGPGELDTANEVAKELLGVKYVVFESKQGLLNFSQYIQIADVFISGSTGTLHIAGALDVPTAGFYTRRRSATSLRWQTLNSENRRLAFSPDTSSEQEDMSSIDIDTAADSISAQFLLEN